MAYTFVAAAYKRGMSALHTVSFIRPSSRSCSSPVLGWGSNSGNKKYDMSSGARKACSLEAPGPSTGTGITGSWGQTGATPLSLPDRSPGEGPMLTYWIKDTLYVAVTNRCNTVPLHVTRGPGFSMGDFSPLPPSYEPSEDELMASITGALAASHSLLNRAWTEVCFAGWGEPTLRWPTVLALAERLRHEESVGKRGEGGRLRLRLSTNGLGNVVQRKSIVRDVAEAFESVTVAVNTADASQYDSLMRPDLSMCGDAEAMQPYTFSCTHQGGTEGGKEGGKEEGREGETLGEVLAFVKECVGSGIDTQITAVARPDVDVEAVRSMAKDVGATFRERPYFP